MITTGILCTVKIYLLISGKFLKATIIARIMILQFSFLANVMLGLKYCLGLTSVSLRLRRTYLHDIEKESLEETCSKQICKMLVICLI